VLRDFSEKENFTFIRQSIANDLQKIWQDIHKVFSLKFFYS